MSSRVNSEFTKIDKNVKYALECNERLVFTKIDKNVKYALECNERLVFKPFLITMIQNINVRTHLVLVGTGWPQELPLEHTVVAIHDKNTWEKSSSAQVTLPTEAWGYWNQWGMIGIQSEPWGVSITRNIFI